MTNHEISQKIAEIGQMLEILDANSFKVSAYERAARIIDMISDSLEDIYQQKGIQGLEEIKGIGVSIAQKIEELLKTGKIKYHDELIKKVPRSIILFSTIPGVGPKTAKKLYDKLKSENISALQKDLNSNQSHKYFKQKTREKILDGISILSQITDRMLLNFALPIAKNITKTLTKYSEISLSDYVGSLRRMKETIGDIDIVACLKDDYTSSSSEVIDRFCREDFVRKIISRGDTKATIMHQKNVHVDLEILPAKEYGSLLQHFTGSKDHNIALRTYAEKNGFSISEHGIKTIKKSTLHDKHSSTDIIRCASEEKVYSTLKMDYIEPELRENQGEIEAALSHKLPKPIKLSDIKGDLQMHTHYSDGQNTVEEMATVCKSLGYDYMAITDHPSTLGVTQGIKIDEIDKYIFTLRRLSHRFGIKIFAGIEANIKPDGSIDLPDKVLSKFDIVLGAIHSSFRQNKLDATKRMIRAIENPFVKIIAHPTGRIINRRPGFEFDWEEVFEACKKTKTILEINSYPDRLDLRDILIRQAIKNDIGLIINTDSHSTKDLFNMYYGVAQARRGWAQNKNIINSLPLKRFQQVLNIH